MEIKIQDMMNEYEVKMFFRFLKENISYEKYIHNIKAREWDTIKSNGIENILLSSFYWSGVAEGSSYWSLMNKKWKRFCINNTL